MNVTHGGDLFAIGKRMQWDWRDVADFSASINPLGPSPRVGPAIVAALDRIVHYPEPHSARLVEALSRKWAIPGECMLLGNGATELLHFLARMRGDEDVTLLAPVFSEFHRAYPHARLLAAMDESQWPSDGFTVVTQPLNPTGEILALEGWLERTSHPVLVDESFLEFTGRESCIRLIGRRPNFFVLRSLTKFYALPGLRIGALLSDAATIATLKEKREPWQVNVLAEEAALEALGDERHSAKTLDFVKTERTWLIRELSALPGLTVHPSEANYLMISLGYSAAALAAFLLRYKILVRDCSTWPGMAEAQRLRVAVRSRAENIRLVDAWRQFSCAD